VIIRERQFLESEISTLEELISQTPEEDVIDRKSLEARKRKVEAELSTLRPPYYESARARLTFRGKPVIRSDGILTKFAVNALNKFQVVVDAVGASQDTQLGSRGVVPNQDRYRLMVTGAGPFGSFGFEVEEAPKDNNMLDPELSPVKEAIDKAKSIMVSASELKDDDLTKAMLDTDPRAIVAIRDFLRLMNDNEAICILESDSGSIQLGNMEQIEAIEECLDLENIRETDIDIIGRFEGALPSHRTFEFFIENRNEMIFGKVGSEIKNVREINDILYKPARIHIHTKQVGTSRPRYTLISYESIKE
jgi:hypothetical protein